MPTKCRYDRMLGEAIRRTYRRRKVELVRRCYKKWHKEFSVIHKKYTLFCWTAIKLKNVFMVVLES